MPIGPLCNKTNDFVSLLKKDRITTVEILVNECLSIEKPRYYCSRDMHYDFLSTENLAYIGQSFRLLVLHQVVPK